MEWAPARDSRARFVLQRVCILMFTRLFSLYNMTAILTLDKPTLDVIGPHLGHHSLRDLGGLGFEQETIFPHRYLPVEIAFHCVCIAPGTDLAAHIIPAVYSFRLHLLHHPTQLLDEGCHLLPRKQEKHAA